MNLFSIHWDVRFRVCATLACYLVAVSFVQAGGDDSSSVIPIAESAERVQPEPITVETVEEGSSSRFARDDAIRAIPFHAMLPEAQKHASQIIDEVSLYRRLPKIHLEADHRVYDFFANHPDVAVSVWRAMKISKVQMYQTGPEAFKTDMQDGGTIGDVQVLLRNKHHYVVSCQGQFRNPALRKPIFATALMHLQPEYNEDGTVTHAVDVFVAFPSQTVETIAKLISPISNRIADRNFTEISLFVEMMSLAMARQPGWVEQLTLDMDGIAEGRTNQMLELTAKVYVDAQRQQRKVSNVQEILPPTTSAMR